MLSYIINLKNGLMMKSLMLVISVRGGSMDHEGVQCRALGQPQEQKRLGAIIPPAFVKCIEVQKAAGHESL